MTKKTSIFLLLSILSFSAYAESLSRYQYAVGATATQLKCPTSASNTSCKNGTTLFNNWSTSDWNFGTSSQYPGLIINGEVHR